MTRDGAGGYRTLLERLDRWFAERAAANPGVIPCQGGCSACCHGPFDVSVADLELVLEGMRGLDPAARAAVRARAGALLGRMRALAPDWAPPYDVADLGDDRFDALCEALATEPCPLLDDAGRCRVYEHRPFVCRLIGLGVRTPAGREIGNACPIQREFPVYAALPPQPFDLEALEADELECLTGAARRLLGSAEAHAYETTLAAAIVAWASPGAGGAAPLSS